MSCLINCRREMSSLCTGTPNLSAVCEAQTPAESVPDMSITPPAVDLKTSTKLCNHPDCRIKLSLLDKGIPCQCTHLFCGKHRFADRTHGEYSHKCPVDYKSRSEEHLKKTVVDVKGEKLTRI